MDITVAFTHDLVTLVAREAIPSPVPISARQRQFVYHGLTDLIAQLRGGADNPNSADATVLLQPNPPHSTLAQDQGVIANPNDVAVTSPADARNEVSSNLWAAASRTVQRLRDSLKGQADPSGIAGSSQDGQGSFIGSSTPVTTAVSDASNGDTRRHAAAAAAQERRDLGRGVSVRRHNDTNESEGIRGMAQNAVSRLVPFPTHQESTASGLAEEEVISEEQSNGEEEVGERVGKRGGEERERDEERYAMATQFDSGDEMYYEEGSRTPLILEESSDESPADSPSLDFANVNQITAPVVISNNQIPSAIRPMSSRSGGPVSADFGLINAGVASPNHGHQSLSSSSSEEDEFAGRPLSSSIGGSAAAVPRGVRNGATRSSPRFSGASSVAQEPSNKKAHKRKKKKQKAKPKRASPAISPTLNAGSTLRRERSSRHREEVAASSAGRSNSNGSRRRRRSTGLQISEATVLFLKNGLFLRNARNRGTLQRSKLAAMNREFNDAFDRIRTECHGHCQDILDGFRRVRAFDKQEDYVNRLAENKNSEAGFLKELCKLYEEIFRKRPTQAWQ